MAREHLTRYICDRCKKTIVEVVYESNNTGPPKPKVVIESKGVGHDVPIIFEDLCKGCQDRCTSLIAQIALMKDDAPGIPDAPGNKDKDKDKPGKSKGKGGGK